jgi:hypothetical protein
MSAPRKKHNRTAKGAESAKKTFFNFAFLAALAVRLFWLCKKYYSNREAHKERYPCTARKGR